MPITYGRNLTAMWGSEHRAGTVLMKAYTPYAAKSDVFLSYRHTDQSEALDLAEYLHQDGRNVYIDIHDDTLTPGDPALEQALITAIENAETMVIVVSDQTKNSWWVPWEIGVSTPWGKPKAMHNPQTKEPLPAFLQKLPRFQSKLLTNLWILENVPRGLRNA
jgi:hypothetical protein